MNIFDNTQEIFTAYYSDYQSIVYGSIYAKIKNVSVCDDLTQEVFMRLYEKIDRVHPDKIRGWLYSTSKNVLLEYYKQSKKTANNIDIDEINDNLAMSFVNSFKDTRLLVEGAIDTLSEGEERQIFELVAINNFSYNETSKLLGMSKRQIQYKYGLILKKFLSHLKASGINNLEDLL